MEILAPVIDSALENATPTTIILLLLFTSFLFTLSKTSIIYDFINKFNQRELLRLKELLADENISEIAKISLRNKIELIVYQEITGIKINNIYLQEQILRYHRLAKGRLKYSDFKRAASFLRIDSNDILGIRQPYWYEKAAHIYWTVSSIFIFAVLSLFLAVFIFFSATIRIKLALLILTISFGAMFFTLSYQASLLPAAKKVKDEIENNPFVLQRNKTIIKLRQAFFDNNYPQLNRTSRVENYNENSAEILESEATFHPLANLSEEERQNLIKQVLGAWKNDSEIDDIFTEIDRNRHQEYGRQINSLDD